MKLMAFMVLILLN